MLRRYLISCPSNRHVDFPSLAMAKDLVVETAAVHAHDKPIVTAAASTPPASAVESGPVAYGDGMSGFLARPADKASKTPRD